MSTLNTMRRGVSGKDLGFGLLGWVANAGIATGAGYLVGRARVRHPDKWYGEHSHRILAAGGKLGSVFLTFMGAPRVLTGALDTVGSSGLALQGCQWGLRHEADKQGQELYVTTKGTSMPGGKRVSLGELPAAQPGATMPWQDVYQLADMR